VPKIGRRGGGKVGAGIRGREEIRFERWRRDTSTGKGLYYVMSPNSRLERRWRTGEKY